MSKNCCERFKDKFNQCINYINCCNRGTCICVMPIWIVNLFRRNNNNNNNVDNVDNVEQNINEQNINEQNNNEQNINEPNINEQNDNDNIDDEYRNRGDSVLSCKIVMDDNIELQLINTSSKSLKLSRQSSNETEHTNNTEKTIETEIDELDDSTCDSESDSEYDSEIIDEDNK